jgi:hydroxymethylpyrimidine/phosphomethylpyrimidine kinase
VDPCAGFGLLADLKVLAAFGVHGCGVVTALCADTPRGGEEVHPVSAELLEVEFERALAEIRPSAVKVGALGRTEQLSVIARRVARLEVPVVLDLAPRTPRGTVLLDSPAIAAIREQLVPSCALLTLDLEGVSALAGLPVADRSAMLRVAREIGSGGAQAVLLEGSTLKGEPADLLWERGRARWLDGLGNRVRLPGARCALSSAIAAGLALGHDLTEAVGQARAYVQALLESVVESPGGSGLVLVDPFAPFRGRALSGDGLV